MHHEVDVGRAGRAVIVPWRWREVFITPYQKIWWKKRRVIQEGSRADKKNAGSQRRWLIRAIIRGRTDPSVAAIHPADSTAQPESVNLR